MTVKEYQKQLNKIHENFVTEITDLLGNLMDENNEEISISEKHKIIKRIPLSEIERNPFDEIFHLDY